jgi:hypothetical protein
MRESIVRPLIVARVLRRFKMNAWLGAVREANTAMAV